MFPRPLLDEALDARRAEREQTTREMKAVVNKKGGAAAVAAVLMRADSHSTLADAGACIFVCAPGGSIHCMACSAAGVRVRLASRSNGAQPHWQAEQVHVAWGRSSWVAVYAAGLSAWSSASQQQGALCSAG